jgi:hypothetical protein
MLGILFSGICFILFPRIGLVSAGIIFLSSVLIDFDHYSFYVIKKKDISLKNAHKWFMKNVQIIHSFPRQKRNKIYCGFYFLHGIEVLVILLFLTIFSKYFFFIFIGFSFHLLLDFFAESFWIDRFDKFSIINDFFKFKKLGSIDDVKD